MMQYQDMVLDISYINNTSSNVNEITNKFTQPQHFTKNQKIALPKLYFNYCWQNITSLFQNNTVSYTYNSVTYTINFPNIALSVAELSDYIQQNMFSNGLYLVDNTGKTTYFFSMVASSNYYGVIVTSTPVPTPLPAGWTNPSGLVLTGFCPQLNIVNANFGNLIGLSVASYPPTATQATQIQYLGTNADINVVNVINIDCNLINYSALTTGTKRIMKYNIKQTDSIGQQITIEPTQPTFYPVSDGQYDEVTLSFYDERHRPLQLLDPIIEGQLLIRTEQKK